VTNQFFNLILNFMHYWTPRVDKYMRSHNMKKKEGDHNVCSVHYVMSTNLYFGQLHDF